MNTELDWSPGLAASLALSIQPYASNAILQQTHSVISQELYGSSHRLDSFSLVFWDQLQPRVLSPGTRSRPTGRNVIPP